MSDEPRAYTADEVRDQLLQSVWQNVRYWGGHDGSNVPADRPKDECLQGVAFSILALLDGCEMSLPAFKLVPDPHPDDEAYCRGQGDNWYSPDHPVEDMLHEHFYRDGIRRDQT
jgi:hypothetical protein